MKGNVRVWPIGRIRKCTMMRIMWIIVTVVKINKERKKKVIITSITVCKYQTT